jgi:hypothetical protein
MGIAIGVVDVNVCYRWTTDSNRTMDGAGYLMASDFVKM